MWLEPVFIEGPGPVDPTHRVVGFYDADIAALYPALCPASPLNSAY
eukprot:CAMPEP_0117570014 /NCGR_PEP_ID=MMETSP0784-20121206/58967_1 /TAXON_ID=39447 /ORGANISM="" /LENGTH=45 /DNA_ID= /DNA_START= /DNA_END= /DNA_ORIENTATION=